MTEAFKCLTVLTSLSGSMRNPKLPKLHNFIRRNYGWGLGSQRDPLFPSRPQDALGYHLWSKLYPDSAFGFTTAASAKPH